MKIKITDAKKADIEKWVKKAAAQTIRDIEKFAKENNLEPKKVALSFLDTLDEVAEMGTCKTRTSEAHAASDNEKEDESCREATFPRLKLARAAVVLKRAGDCAHGQNRNRRNCDRTVRSHQRAHAFVAAHDDLQQFFCCCGPGLQRVRA